MPNTLFPSETPFAATLIAAGIPSFADSSESKPEFEELFCRRASFPEEGQGEPLAPRCLEVAKENTTEARFDRAVAVYMPSSEKSKKEQFATLRWQCQLADGKLEAYRKWCLWAKGHMKQLHQSLVRTHRLVAILDGNIVHLERENMELRQVHSQDVLDQKLKEFRDAAAMADEAARVVTERLEKENETLLMLRRDLKVLLAGQEKFAKDRKEWAATEESKLQDFRAAVMWEGIHLTHRKTAITMDGRANYTVQVAWEHKDGNASTVVLNPDHPYWMGRRFAKWLKTGKHLTDSGGPWFRADTLPGHPLALYPMQGNQDLSWFQGIEHELNNATAPELPKLNLLPSGEFYQNLAEQQK